LLPKVTLVEAFAGGQMLGEISVHVATNRRSCFDLYIQTYQGLAFTFCNEHKLYDLTLLSK